MAQPQAFVMPRDGSAAQEELGPDQDSPVPWSVVTDIFASGGWFWLSTTSPDGAPHAVPVLAAWADPVFYVASNDRTRKSRNLYENGRCVLTKETPTLHLVVRALARHSWDDATMTRASRAFAQIYQWTTRVGESELEADYGAPTSGGPPYQVFEITPVTAFAFPTDAESTAPTKYDFTD